MFLILGGHVVFIICKTYETLGVAERWGMVLHTAQLEASAGALTAGAVYRISGSGAGLGTAGFAGRGKWY